MTITFDHNVANFILGAVFGYMRKDCVFCGTLIIPANLSAVTPEGCVCNNTMCLIRLADALKGES